MQLALIVAQTSGEGGHLSGIKLEALSTGLQRVAVEAKKRAGEQQLEQIQQSRRGYILCLSGGIRP